MPVLPFIDPAAQFPDDGAALLSAKEDKASKGVANGYAPLDATAKVPSANLPAASANLPAATTSVSGLMSSTDKSKLDGVASGAEVNVNADWNAASGDAQILNKPNSFAPSAHTHAIIDVTNLQTALDGKQASGSYAPSTGISPSAITGTAVVTADSRLSDSRTPTSHTHGNLTNDGKVGATINLPLITTVAGAITTGSFGTSANTFAQGNDSRLSDTRDPNAHTHAIADVTSLQAALDDAIYSSVIGPNLDKDVDFTQTGGGDNSEIGAWGFGVADGSGTTASIEPIGVTLDNSAKLRKGTTDAGDGGNKGIALECSAQYELKWEAGRLYTMQQNGTTIRSVEHCMSAPTATDDDTSGYVIGTRWVMDSGKTYVCTDATEATAIWQLKFSQENSDDGAGGATAGGTIDLSADLGNGGSIDLSGGASGETGGSIISTCSDGLGGYCGTLNMSAVGGQSGGSISTYATGFGAGGSIDTTDAGGSIDTHGYGGSINTSLSGGSINTSGGAGAGGSINTSGTNGAGGSINTSDSGGSINTSGTSGAGGSINISGFDGGAGGSITSIGGMGGGGGAINTSAGEDGAGGAINLSNGGGSIISTGYALGIVGGTLDMSGGESGGGGSIDTSAGIDGAGGSINVSNLGGSINTSNAGGLINTSGTNGAGGSINTSGFGVSEPGGAINTSGGANGGGGSINTSNGGGSINTTSGGGSIDTTGQGSIGLGAGDIADSQTLITGTATVNRTATFPDKSGMIALVRQTSTSITFGVCAGNGAVVASTQSVDDAEVGDAVIVACTTDRTTLTAGGTSNIIFDGVVTDYEEVSVRAHNPHSNSITLGALNFKIVVFKL